MNWVAENGYLYRETEGNRALVSRLIKDEVVTNQYWDYLAWAVYMTEKKKVLMLGFGAGTVFRLLMNWGWEGTFHGVENNSTIIDWLKDDGILDVPNLTLIEAHAENFIENTNEKYDAIIIDLYDDIGPNKHFYSSDGMKLLKGLLHEKGQLFFHCIDPAVKYMLFNLTSSNEKPLSFSYYTYQELTVHFKHLRLFPLATSCLVIGAEKEIALSKHLTNSDTHLERLTEMFVRGEIEASLLSALVTAYRSVPNYDQLNENDWNDFVSVILSIPINVRNRIIQYFQIDLSKIEKRKQFYFLSQNGHLDIEEIVATAFETFLKLFSQLEDAPRELIALFLSHLKESDLPFRDSLILQAKALLVKDPIKK
ncbi:hypothetical protein ABES25_12765 [Bacillus gobiensis]|uniref:spermidine synthase n=1 Tax=Bacillus gobiensis TaxID=1441095 RepID=UPI003D20922F